MYILFEILLLIDSKKVGEVLETFLALLSGPFVRGHKQTKQLVSKHSVFLVSAYGFLHTVCLLLRIEERKEFLE